MEGAEKMKVIVLYFSLLKYLKYQYESLTLKALQDALPFTPIYEMALLRPSTWASLSNNTEITEKCFSTRVARFLNIFFKKGNVFCCCLG